MGQALGNLLSNAVKFTARGGEVTTRIWVQAGELCIEVADSGPGIPSEERERIFQPFYRGAHGRRIVQGMGLGLSIAREIVLAHQGTLAPDFAQGKGARFIIRLPVEP
jgi:signal transduction histidine kinase